MMSKNKKVVVVGAGIMGPGIALVCAQAGHHTSILRRRPELLQQTIEAIKSNLQMLIDNGLISSQEASETLKRIEAKTDLAEAVKEADFVIEAIPEDMVAKKSLFKELDRLCSSQTILASNTSSFSITEIASVTNRPDRVVGTHWWNPPHLMPLVEIVKGKQTSEETVRIAKEFVSGLGKIPVVCKDSPGFLGVRLQAALVLEAIRMLEEGLATAEDIDMAVKLTLGLRLPILGPLEIVDLGGVDTFLYAYSYLYDTLGERFKLPQLLRRKVESNELGIKTGKGFYEYTKEQIEAKIRRRDQWLIEQLKKLQAQRNPLQ